MSSVGNILFEKEILLESGTNEVEILVFRVADYSLGVNVAKVREVLPAQKITRIPKSHQSIDGCFTLREHVVPCVSLRTHLGEERINKDEATIILTEFNQSQTAFEVDSVERIHRVSWEHVLAAPGIIANCQIPVTAVTNLEGRLILMLDFEMIADQVSERAHRIGAVPNVHNLQRSDIRILLADDSATVRQAVTETLNKSGYTNLKVVENGEQAWDWLNARLGETGDVSLVADLVISDVEMPRIDGLHLTKKIKEHPELKHLRVLLYSSIMTEDNRKKGEAVKADEMITKPDLLRIVSLADEMVVQGDSSSELNTSPSPPITTTIAESPEGAETAVEENTVQSGTRAEESAELASKTIPDHESNRDEQEALWLTFRAELADRVVELRQLRQLAAVPCSQDIVTDVLRVLHSIKSASMVVPLDVVTRVTHDAEDAVEAVRNGDAVWPAAMLADYAEWLRELANPSYDAKEVQAVLSDAPSITIEAAAYQNT